MPFSRSFAGQILRLAGIIANLSEAFDLFQAPSKAAFIISKGLFEVSVSLQTVVYLPPREDGAIVNLEQFASFPTLHLLSVTLQERPSRWEVDLSQALEGKLAFRTSFSESSVRAYLCLRKVRQ